MRASQHNRVGSRIGPVSIGYKAGRNLRGNGVISDTLAPECRFGERGEMFGADEGDFATLREIPDQRLGIFTLHGAFRAQH